MPKYKNRNTGAVCTMSSEEFSKLRPSIKNQYDKIGETQKPKEIAGDSKETKKETTGKRTSGKGTSNKGTSGKKESSKS